MTIEAPVSRYKRKTLVVYIAAVSGFGIWCIFDGFFNKPFIAEHSPAGVPDNTLLFNRYAWPVLFLLGAGLGLWLRAISCRKVVATDRDLVINGTLTVPYPRIDQIDKTYFETKGFFALTYKDEAGKARTLRLDDREYDNLGPILDRLCAELTQPQAPAGDSPQCT